MELQLNFFYAGIYIRNFRGNYCPQKSEWNPSFFWQKMIKCLKLKTYFCTRKNQPIFKNFLTQRFFQLLTCKVYVSGAFLSFLSFRGFIFRGLLAHTIFSSSLCCHPIPWFCLVCSVPCNKYLAQVRGVDETGTYAYGLYLSNRAKYT